MAAVPFLLCPHAPLIAGEFHAYWRAMVGSLLQVQGLPRSEHACIATLTPRLAWHPPRVLWPSVWPSSP